MTTPASDTPALMSMTGFGAASFEADGQRYRVEVKTVNHRHLNMRFHMPPELSVAEAPAKALIGDRLGRGAADISVALEAQGERRVQVDIDRDGAAAVGKALRQLATDLHTPPPSLELLLRLGDFVKVRAARVDPEVLVAALLDGLDRALLRVVVMRRREGEALAADLMARLDVLDGLLDAVEAEAPLVQSSYERRLRARLDEAARKQGIELDPGRLATELVVFADKSDVTEETVRARTHIAGFRQILDGAREAKGKRLDFLAQELGREFNTIGSKCRDAGMAGAVVDAKVELERIREQVQNIA